METQIRNYEHVGSISHLGVSKLAKITNTMQQKSDDGNLKVTQNSRKSKLGRERD